MEMTESATGLLKLSFVEAVLDGACMFSNDSQKRKAINYGTQRSLDALHSLLRAKKCEKVDIKYKNVKFINGKAGACTLGKKLGRKNVISDTQFWSRARQIRRLLFLLQLHRQLLSSLRHAP